MRLAKYFLLISIILCVQGCPERYSKEPDMMFTIRNMSNDDIYFYANCEDSIISIKDIPKGYLIFLEKNKDYQIDFWTKLFRPNRKLNIFFLKKSILDTHSWEEIQNNALFEEHLALTLDEVISKNYIIEYEEK